MMVASSVSRDPATDPAAFLHRLATLVTWSVERLAVSWPTADGKQPVRGWTETTDLTKMTHVSVGLFRVNDPRDAGRFLRRAETWRGTIGLLLDDVGEEKKGGKLVPPALQPTVKIETKPGSEQWLYLFKEPLRDAQLVDRMMQALVDAGHADAGGSVGRTALIRLFRLPGSDPKGRGFPARISFADWSRRFPTDPALLFGPRGFNLPLPPSSKILRGAGAPLFNILSDDPLLRWMAAKGVLIDLQVNSQGWAAIRCPWAAQHTGAVITGTGYRSSSPAGINCYHSACQHRQPVDFLTEWASEGAPVLPAGSTIPPMTDDLRQTLRIGLASEPHFGAFRRRRGDHELDLRFAHAVAGLGLNWPQIARVLADWWFFRELPQGGAVTGKLALRLMVIAQQAHALWHIEAAARAPLPVPEISEAEERAVHEILTNRGVYTR